MPNYVAGNGGIWAWRLGDEIPRQHATSAAGLAAAKAYIDANPPGLIVMVPTVAGAIPYLGGWGNIALQQVIFDGANPEQVFTRIHFADETDPTKQVFWDMSSIATATERSISVPNWSGILPLPVDLGSSGQFLRSNGAGVQPTWAAVALTNALLDGTNHTDTLAEAVVRGDLIVGNSTPKWSRLALGTTGQVLTSNGTDVAWSSQPSAVEHNALSHLKPFAVTNCNWSNTTSKITHASSGLANVKVGDFVFLGTNTTASTQGARVTTWNNAGDIDVDLTNSGGTLTNVTMIFVPGDHWDNTVALDTGAGAGLLLTLGRGTYNTTNTSGTFQELRGPINWMPHVNGNLPCDARFMGSSSAVTLSGFCLTRQGSTAKSYFYTGGITADRVFTLPDSSGSIMTQTSTDNSISGQKIFTGVTVLDSDGTTNRTHFRTGGGATFLAFSASGTTLRNVTWPDVAGNAVVRNAQGNHTGLTAALGSQTLATAPPVGMYRISGFMNCTVPGGSNAELRINWTDDTARTNQVVCTLDKAATNFAQGTMVIYVGSGNVTYDTTYAGTGTYTARIRMEAI